MQPHPNLKIRFSSPGSGFSGNAVNSAMHRRNALISYCAEDGSVFQFSGWYDAGGHIWLAMRKNNGAWVSTDSGFRNSISDAHNSLAIAVDGRGYLHAAWCRHDHHLHYAAAPQPLSLKLEERHFPGSREAHVTYPEFFIQSTGDLILLYRRGSSGNGDILLDRYDCRSERWVRLHDRLIDGESRMSPYWQACLDHSDRLHISWCWRDTSDASTNHDICYLRSTDASCTAFEDAAGKPVHLPCSCSFDPAVRIPTGQSLVNQTAMTADKEGNPVIISMWGNGDDFDYRILRFDKEAWNVYSLGRRPSHSAFSGKGTLDLSFARPEILSADDGFLLILRDQSSGQSACLLPCRFENGRLFTEAPVPLVSGPLGVWEPLYDPVRWRTLGILSLFIQKQSYSRDISWRRPLRMIFSLMKQTDRTSPIHIADIRFDMPEKEEHI